MNSANMELGRADMEPTIHSIIAKINDLQTRVSTYASDITNNPLIMRSSDDQTIMDNYNLTLTNQAQNIRDSILELEPKRDGNYTTMQNWAPILLSQLDKMKEKIALAKSAEHNSPNEGKIEDGEIKANVMYYSYMFSLIFVIFILAALFYIYKNPEVKNLDMFILGLAIIILAYYGYDYYANKEKKK